MNTRSGKPSRILEHHGIIIGSHSPADQISSTLDLIVSNNQTGLLNESAVSFEMDLEAHLNVSMLNFKVYPGVEEVLVFNINKTEDNVNMY